MIYIIYFLFLYTFKDYNDDLLEQSFTKHVAQVYRKIFSISS